MRPTETDIARTRGPERPPGNLPLELSSFVGREREISEVERLLADDRLLTLSGPGGCGKTRLALVVASDLAEEFEDGAWWVGLAALSDAAFVPQAVTQALGVREVPGRTPTEALVEHLTPRSALLVLDNCEHLIEACAALAETLLRSCPNLKILATSREALGIAGERPWVVPSLSMPDPGSPVPIEELACYEAVRLFVERARVVSPGFELTEKNACAVARVCQRLDGIPLAIELAAARARVLSVEQISERLKDPLGLLTTGSRSADARHQTLRTTLKWSYDLLCEPERVLFRRLSVFAGGWGLEAAEVVGAGDGIERSQVLDLLSRLVEQSLVVADAGVEEGAPRYRMLEPIRQYAQELLEESGEADDVRGRHAALFMALAERAHPELRGPDQVPWMHRLAQENDNLRAAIAWALSAGEAESAARLGWAMWPFWWYTGNHREGRRLVEAALGSGYDLPPELRIRATVSAAIMTYGQADYEAVVRYMEELREMSRLVGGDIYADAYATAGLGLVAMNRGDFEEATALLEEALPLFMESGEVWTAAQTHTWLGIVLVLQGDHDRAVPRFEEGLALARRIGDRTGAYNALYNLALVALVRGEHELAARRFQEGMTLSEEMGDRANVAYCLEGLAGVAGALGQAERSARLFGVAEGLFEAIGVPVWTFYGPVRSLYERTVAGLRARMGDAAFEAAKTEGRQMALERAVEYALEAPPAPPPEDKAGLSGREIEVLGLVAEGLTDAQVAERLHLSPRTVGWHLRSVYRKLGVSSRTAAIRDASTRSLI